ncbi:GGDEF domain-containing protein [Paenibacillus campi]|uniref:GGDEF domain-containing protein n=1 Tax=Paenibacillus campi TaxID=3106031 RepID=UPI002AFE2246|nr:GGDEF domain-containing protein [Paenibacillus sp. SGZ-1009]
MFTKIGEIAEQVPIVEADTCCSEVDALFKLHRQCEGLAVRRRGTEPALMMRVGFYQHLATHYGYNLYMGRPIRLLANRQPLVVDYCESITDVSVKAMQRKDEELYDLLLVSKDGELYGAVTIRQLLLAVADLRTESATFLNALTGLPGNRIIDEQLELALKRAQYSVLYIDLDHFKTYNDIYGFKMGDRMIQETANVLSRVVTLPDQFLGHIGGDDFIVVMNHYDVEPICRLILTEFEQLKKEMYHTDDLQLGYVMAEDRLGNYGPIPLVTLSIAIVSNRQRTYRSVDEIVGEAARLKKVCKSIAGYAACSNDGLRLSDHSPATRSYT